MKRYLLLLLNILMSYVVFAQQKDSLNSKTLLWRVSNKEMKKPSYIFGTIHLICKDDYFWTPAMQKSLSACDEVCFEMDMDDPSLMMQVATGMIDNSGKQLKDYFTEQQYKQVEKFVTDSLNMDISMFAQMKPAALQLLFSSKVVNCDNPVSYEATIMDEAKKTNKNIDGLEDVNEQLALLNSLPVDSIIQDIVEAVTERGSDASQYMEMVSLYKKQDLPALFALIQRSKELGDNMGEFLDVRNEKWIERIIDRMDQHAVFFAIGAGHLWGDNGVIQLMQNAGYTVTPVK